MRGGSARRALVWSLRIAAGIVAAPLLYFVAALLLGLVPANVAFHQPAQGVTIFIQSNGVHTWIVMPKVNAEMDWRPYARAGRSAPIRAGAGPIISPSATAIAIST